MSERLENGNNESRIENIAEKQAQKVFARNESKKKQKARKNLWAGPKPKLQRPERVVNVAISREAAHPRVHQTSPVRAQRTAPTDGAVLPNAARATTEQGATAAARAAPSRTAGTTVTARSAMATTQTAKTLPLKAQNAAVPATQAKTETEAAKEVKAGHAPPAEKSVGRRTNLGFFHLQT